MEPIKYTVKPGAITCFREPWAFLSNFYPAPIIYCNKIYATAEHLYQAEKSMSAGDREVIRTARTPGDAKRRGKAVKARPGWEANKVPTMVRVIRLKFSQHPDLRKRLLDTGDAQLVEGNTWGDTFWGAVAAHRSESGTWYGRNMLGELLMKLREEFRKAVSEPGEPEPKRNLLI